MVPPLGQFGFPRPSAHWDLALPGVLSNLCLSQGFPRAFRGGAGRRPAALAVARGGTGAALRAMGAPPKGAREWESAERPCVQLFTRRGPSGSVNRKLF